MPMNVKCFAFLLFCLFVICNSSFAQKPSSDELADILGIESWRVPTPNNEKFEWDVAIVDYAKREFTNINAAELNSQKKTLITLREIGKDTYEYTVKTDKWLIRSVRKIDVCTEQEKKDNVCENFYSIKWFAEAKPYGDGRRFVIADITKRDSPKKQIVLRLNRRLPNGNTSYP
jgi:hypothetical protein